MFQTLTQIKALLTAHGLRPRHRFGQNFLHDHNQLRRILDAADVQPRDLVLEVGPGTGALSIALLAAGAELIAVEIDADLAPILQDQFQPWADRATLLITDILADKRHLAPDVVAHLDRPFKLIANLPYNVATPLLINLAIDHPAMTRAVVMIQREVAQRIIALPDSKDFSPLSVLLQVTCDVSIIARLPPGCFWPAPDVDSAVIGLERKAQPPQVDLHQLAGMLQKVFGQRRKQLGSVLGRQTVADAGFDPMRRPEQLSVDELVQLAQRVPVQP